MHTIVCLPSVQWQAEQSLDFAQRHVDQFGKTPLMKQTMQRGTVDPKKVGHAIAHARTACNVSRFLSLTTMQLGYTLSSLSLLSPLSSQKVLDKAKRIHAAVDQATKKAKVLS